jgi:hypothetical protein
VKFKLENSCKNCTWWKRKGGQFGCVNDKKDSAHFDDMMTLEASDIMDGLLACRLWVKK